MKGYRHLLVLLTTILNGVAIYAQTETVAVRSLLPSIEKRYDIYFSYIDSDVDDVYVEPPALNISLDACLRSIEKNSCLKFSKLNDKFITISKIEINRIKVCGYVTDGDNNDLLPGVAIYSMTDVTYSDSLGFFQLNDIVDSVSLYVRALGYNTVILNAKDLQAGSCKNIALRPSRTILNEVLITNYVASGIDKHIDGSYTVNKANLQILPGQSDPDVLRALQVIPGIQSIDESVSSINVRGGTHDQNLVLWEGIKMYQVGHFFGLISAINPYLIDRVKLQKNGTPASTPEGISSTIQINSEDNVSDHLSGGGGINLLSADAFIKIPLTNKSSVQLATRRSITDIIHTPTFNQYFKRAFSGTDVTNDSPYDSLSILHRTFSFYDVTTKFLYDFSNTRKLRLNFMTISNDLKYRENSTVPSQPVERTSSLTQRNTSGGLSYEHAWNKIFTTTAHAAVSSYNLTGLNNDVSSDQRLFQSNDVTDFSVKIDSKLATTATTVVSFGAYFDETGIRNVDDINNPAFSRIIKDVSRTYACYSDVTYQSSMMKIQAGARMTYYSKSKHTRFEPRLAFHYKLSNRLLLEVLGEMRSQSTTQVIDFQYDFLGVEKRRWMMADDNNIPVLTSEQISTGLHYSWHNLLATIEGYYKVVDGLYSSSQGFQNQFEYERSSGSYTSSGMDIMFNHKFDLLNTWISYSLSRSDYTFRDFSPQTFPSNLQVDQFATVGSSYRVRDFELSVGINFHTGKPITKPVADTADENGEIQYDNPNSSRLTNYARVDLSGNYHFNFTERVKALCGLSIWNLLDRENTINAYYVRDENNKVSLVEKRGLSFTPNMTFRVMF